MTAAQFRSALRRLGLSQLETARRLDVSKTSVQRWYHGDKPWGWPVPGPVCACVEAWLNLYDEGLEA